MNPHEYRQIYTVEGWHWWFVGRRADFLAVLRRWPAGGGPPRRLLDVGCGTGRFLEDAGRLGRAWGLDPAVEALACCRERGLTRVVRAGAEALPFRDGSFDVVTASDVLEHLDDDVAGAREIFRVLAPGGRALVGVPAFPFLWSEHDVALQHRRRYRAAALRRTLEAAGFQPEWITYANALPFLLAAPFRLLRRLLRGPTRGDAADTRSDVFVALPGWLNAMLRGAVRAEAECLGRLPIPFGLSLIALARRP